MVIGLGVVSSALAAPVQFFYIPFPEDHLLQSFRAINASNPNDPITSYVAITAVADGTIVYYDQWENGYDIDISSSLDTYSAANGDGTQIWGDGVAANGIAPGTTDDLISAGAVIVLNNPVTSTARQTDIDFDGGDKIAATKTIAMTRSSWAAGSGTLLAGCVEVFDTNNWGTDYRAPVGIDIPDSTAAPQQGDFQMFEYTALSIMAGEGGATVQIDAAGDGTFETIVPLDEGESAYATGISLGGHVISDNPVQVDIFAGDAGSNYESRDSALIPTDLWASAYYTPVSTPSGSETTVWLYNPRASSISVSYQRRASGTLTTSALTVPGGTKGGYLKQVLPDGTGARFFTSGAAFYAFSTTDSNNSATNNGQYTGNQAWDWGYTLIPETMLTSQALVGLGIGRDPTSPTSPLENGNPIWVTPLGNGNTATTVYVDFDADPSTGPLVDPGGQRYDASYSLRELDQAKVYAQRLAVDASSSSGTGSGAVSSTLTFAHTTGSLPSRLMVVGVAIGNSATTLRDVQSVTYGGTPLTLVDKVRAPAGGGGTPNSRPQTEIWALANPVTGTANVVVTLTGDATFSAGATTFSGADVSAGLTSALGTFISASASSGTNQSVTLATSAGQIVYDAVAAANFGGSGTSPSVFAAGGGQTQRWQLSSRSEEGTNDRRLQGAGSTETATGTSTTMSWTSTTSYPWAMGALPIRPVKFNQTGLLIYTRNPAIKLAVAWGQDPLTASAGAPGLDVGTSVPPMPEFTAGKDGTLYDDPATPGLIDGDADGDGYISPGDVIVYPITVLNVSRVPVPDVIVRDDVPVDTTYVPNSTYFGSTPIPDNATGTPYPLDGAGYNLGSLPVGASYTVTFRVVIDAFEDLTPGTPAIFNGAMTSALGWDDPVDDKAFLRGRISDFVWYDQNRDGVQDPTEEGIAGVEVTLFDGEGNVVYDKDGLPIAIVTDDTGHYDFKGLLPGDYIVEFVPPEGAQLTEQAQGGDRSVDSDADPATGRSPVVTLSGGEHDPTVDTGIVLIIPTRAVVSSFDTHLVDGEVVVEWRTASETGTAGYFVERLSADGAGWLRLNDIIVAACLESHGGASYALVDREAPSTSALTYRLVEVEMDGGQQKYGPYQTRPDEAGTDGQTAEALAGGSTALRIPVAAAAQPATVEESAVQAVAATAGTPDRLRIEVKQSGLYLVEAADLASGLGLAEADAVRLLRDKGVKLTSRGKSVAYLPAADGSALFFYAEAIDSIYTVTNVYWLAVGKGTTMATRAAAPKSTATATSFRERAHAEQDLIDVPALFHDPECDFWVWDYLVAGDEGLGSKTFALQAPGALKGIRLEVLLNGLTDSGKSEEHRVEVRLNKTTLGTASWRGTEPHLAVFDIPAGVSLRSANQVKLTAALGSQVDYSMVAVDSFDLIYERSLTAVDDQLQMTATSKGAVKVGGLSSTSAWVLDLATPLTPVLVRATSSGGGSSSVTFGAEVGRKYLIATAQGALRPAAIIPLSGTILTAGATGAGGADYLVIASESLYDAAARFASYREEQGLRTRVVTTSQIYDAFNHGIASPHAIRNFIAHATARWSPTPRYVLLAGDGSYDYKDNTGRGDSLIPPLMMDTDVGLVASDQPLADVSGGDGVPEVALGRIPALTTAALDDVLGKVAAYESNALSGQLSVVLAADNADHAGSFANDSDGLADLLPSSSSISRIYLDTLPPAVAQALLLDSFGGSAGLINYVGHGGVDVLADEGLLTTADVAALPAVPRLPVLTALSCLVGQFALPGYDGLGEVLVQQPAAGAIAVWAPCAMEENDDSVRLGAWFMQASFGPSSAQTLGDVVRDAISAGAAQGVPLGVLQTYNLLGDPALSLRW